MPESNISAKYNIIIIHLFTAIVNRFLTKYLIENKFN